MPFPAGGYEMAIGHWPAPCQLHPAPLASNRSQTLGRVGTAEPNFWINSLHICLYRDPINYPLQHRGLSDHLWEGQALSCSSCCLPLRLWFCPARPACSSPPQGLGISSFTVLTWLLLTALTAYSLSSFVSWCCLSRQWRLILAQISNTLRLITFHREVLLLPLQLLKFYLSKGKPIGLVCSMHATI